MKKVNATSGPTSSHAVSYGDFVLLKPKAPSTTKGAMGRKTTRICTSNCIRLKLLNLPMRLSLKTIQQSLITRLIQLNLSPKSLKLQQGYVAMQCSPLVLLVRLILQRRNTVHKIQKLKAARSQSFQRNP
jgi:hypothetical protein